MIKLRLRRTGSKKRPSYRIVVAPSTAPRDGRFLEIVGYYNPLNDPPTVSVKEARLFHWLSVGGQMTDSLKRILKYHGTIERYNLFKSGELTKEDLDVDTDKEGKVAESTETEVSEVEAPEIEMPEVELPTSG